MADCYLLCLCRHLAQLFRLGAVGGDRTILLRQLLPVCFEMRVGVG